MRQKKTIFLKKNAGKQVNKFIYKKMWGKRLPKKDVVKNISENLVKNVGNEEDDVGKKTDL